MALKIWNIVKANSRIEELETQLAAKDAELAALAGNPAQIEAAAQAQQAELTQVKADLATAKQTIGTVETTAKSQAAQIAKLTEDLAAANAKLASVPAQVEAAATAKSIQISASQGVPPLPIKSGSGPGNPKSDKKLTVTERCIEANRANQNPATQ